MKQKIYNTLYGAIVADALGVPVEFKDRALLKKKPVTDMMLIYNKSSQKFAIKIPSFNHMNSLEFANE